MRQDTMQKSIQNNFKSNPVKDKHDQKQDQKKNHAHDHILSSCSDPNGFSESKKSPKSGMMSPGSPLYRIDPPTANLKPKRASKLFI